MAKARVLVLLIFIATETLVVGDSVPAKVPVRDEVTNAKESNKQRPTISNSRIDIPPSKGNFRILKSVSSSVSSSASRLDGEHSDTKRKNTEKATGTADEDSDRVEDERIPPRVQLYETSLDNFNFDDFLISVTSKSDIKTDSTENASNQRPFSLREPVKPMPTKIARSKFENGAAKHKLVVLDHNKEQKDEKEPPVINSSNFTVKQSDLSNSVRLETTQVKRRRPSVMRKSRRIPTSQTSQLQKEQSLMAKLEGEADNKGVKDPSVTTFRSSKSRRPTILPEKTRQRLFPPRRNLTRNVARPQIKTYEKREQTPKTEEGVNFLSTSKQSTTTTISPTTKQTNIVTERPFVEVADADYLTYGELYQPAPPEARYTLTPKVVNNVIVRKDTPSSKALKTKLLNRNRIFQSRRVLTPENLSMDDETGHLTTSLQEESINNANEVVTEKAVDNQIQTNTESMVVQHGPGLFEFDSKGSIADPRPGISANPEQFDYTNYEDLVEFYDYPEDYRVNDNSGTNIFDNFQYGYKVSEKSTRNYQTRSENRDGKKVSGTYEVALPDGRIQLVNYVADDDGFKAEVTYKKDNNTFSSELQKVSPAGKRIKERGGRTRVNLNSRKSVNNLKIPQVKLKKSQINSVENSVLKEVPTFSSKNSQMTPHPSLHRVNSGRQRSRDNSLVNSHFDSEPNLNIPVTFNAKDEVSGILQNHGLLKPSTNTRRGPIPKPIPPHGHREVAKIPPNPFNKKPKKKSHVPVKPQPKLVSTIAPSKPTEPPVHPLLKPGAFNRPVHIDRNPRGDFHVTVPPLQIPPQHSRLQFPPQRSQVQFPPQRSQLPFPPQHSHLEFPAQRSPFVFPANSLELERNRLSESHHEQHDPYANTFQRRRPIEHNPVFPNTPQSIHKQLTHNQNKKGKINFDANVPVTTPSPNPFKVVVERIRPSTYNPFQTHFITPRTFPLSQEQTLEPFLNQPNYSQVDYRELSHIELLKTPENEPIYYEHTGVYSSADYPAADEELIHRSISHTHVTIPNEIHPVTTQRPFFTFSNEKFPSISTERTSAITPKSIFSQDSFGRHFTTVAPFRKSKFKTTSVPNKLVTSIIPFRLMTPVSPATVHFPITPTPAPILKTTARSRPLFFNYPSKNGTPTPTLVYHPDNPIFIHALGQTHAIPLLLPYEGSASEKSETKARKSDRHVSDILSSKELKFQKSDIYPEPPPRFSIK